MVVERGKKSRRSFLTGIRLNLKGLVLCDCPRGDGFTANMFRDQGGREEKGKT